MFEHLTNAELRDVLTDFAEAQAKLATSTSKDRTFWHHVTFGYVLIEAAKRLSPEPKWEDMP